LSLWKVLTPTSRGLLAAAAEGPARIAENAAGQTWPGLRRELDKIHVGTFTGPAGTFRQRTELTKRHRDILKALQIDAPPRVYQLKLPAEA